MDTLKKQGRYDRIYDQLVKLLTATKDKTARMSTVCAILHHKMDYFFWTGFYILREEELIAGPYQGPLACQVLERGKGVCWAAVNSKKVMIVSDVEKFPGHIACDSRSRSEIVIPLFNSQNDIWAVLDIDSRELNSFDTVDRENLLKITNLI